MNKAVIMNNPIFSTFHYVAVTLIVILGTVLIANILQRLFTRFLEKSSEDMKVNVAQYAFLKHLLTAAVYVTGLGVVIYLIPPLRSLSLSLFAGSGILAVIIGFASQHSLANIVSGIFITIFKPFRVGDRVRMVGKDITGTVEDITLRHTVIKTFENKRIIIPNSVISTELVENSNIIDEKICKIMEMGISYDSDVNKAIDIIREEAMKHLDCMDNRDEEQKEKGIPIVIVRVTGFSDSAVMLRAWIWTKDQPTAFQMGCDLNKSIKERFDNEGVEIPFPHRTIVYKDSVNK